MASFPGSLASFAGFTAAHTLAADNHAAQHNLEQSEILAVQTKVGTGSSTPTANKVLTGTGTGTSNWSQVDLTTTVTGVLPVANGGIGQTSLTGLILPNLITSNPVISGTITGSATYDTPILIQPMITDYTNAVHTHISGVQGGQLNAGNALVPGTLTYGVLGVDSSWAWQSWTPTLGNITLGNGTVTALYTQIGKTIYFSFNFTLGSTSAVGTSPNFTLPVTASSSYAVGAGGGHQIGISSYLQPGVQEMGGVMRLNSTTVAQFLVWNAAGTFITSAGISSTAPFTWASTNVIFAEGFYQAA